MLDKRASISQIGTCIFAFEFPLIKGVFLKNSKAIQTASLGIIFLVVCIDLIGFGMVLPLLPIYAKSFGASPLAIGLLAVSFSITQFIFNPVWGALSDHYGRRPILLLSLMGATIFYALFGWAPSLMWLFVARTCAGIFAGNISAAMAYVADITSKENRAKGMGLIGAAFAIGFVVGPAVGGFLSKYSYSMPGYAAACLSFTALILAIFKLPESLKPENRKRGVALSYDGIIRPIRVNMKRPAVARPMLVYFLGILAFACMQITFPLYMLETLGYDVMETGYLFAFVGIVVMVFQGSLVGRLSNMFGEGPLALIGIALNMFGLLLLPVANTLTLLLLVLTIFGIGVGLNNPTLSSLISLGSDESEQGAVMGVSRSLNTFARILGPLWGGWSYGALGMVWTYWFAAIVLFFALIVGLPLYKMRPALHLEVVPE